LGKVGAGIEAEQLDVTGGRRDQAEDEGDTSGLPRAVGPQEAVDATSVNF